MIKNYAEYNKIYLSDSTFELKKNIDPIFIKFENDLKYKHNEGILTTTSLIIALPAIFGLISRIGKIAGNLINKISGKKPNSQSDYQKWMTKLGNIADQLHHLYLGPIESAISKFVKDKHKAHSIANGIFHVIVASFLIASGVTAYKAFHAKNVSMATLESALTAIKGGEIKAFITNLFE